MARYLGIRQVRFSDGKRPVEVYSDDSGNYFSLEGTRRKVRTDVYFDLNTRRWKASDNGSTISGNEDSDPRIRATNAELRAYGIDLAREYS